MSSYTKSFYTDLNEEETIQNVKSLLNAYSLFKELGMRSNSVSEMDLQSPTMSSEPKAPNVRNSLEDRTLEAISESADAYWHEVHCRHSIEAIQDEELRLILKKKYIENDTNVAIQYDLHLPKETLRRKLREACLTFANIYGLEELRVKLKS